MVDTVGETAWDRLRLVAEAVSASGGSEKWSRLVERAPVSGDATCEQASAFLDQMTDGVVAPLGDEPSRGQITQAKYLLQEHWHVWRRRLTSNHYQGTAETLAHRCVDQVYLEIYDTIDAREKQIFPAATIISDYEELKAVQSAVELARQPQQTIEGLILGDTLEDEP